MSLHHSVRLDEERCIDCGSCGSPSCRSLAEDIVRGHARETDCVFRLRDRIRDLTEEMLKLEGIMPPGTDRF